MTLHIEGRPLCHRRIVCNTYLHWSERESLRIFGILLKINFDGISSLKLTEILSLDDDNDDNGDEDDLYVIDSDFMMSFQTETQQIFLRMKMYTTNLQSI